MIPSAANSDYPTFVANQVLTSDNLNDLFGYLDEQQRITRINLLGIGIVCGLQVRSGSDSDGLYITITKGCAITSQGYLVTVPKIKYHYYNEFDPVKCTYYEPFVNIDAKTRKMLLWELKQKGDTEDNDNPFHSLNDPANFLSDKVVLLFVELLEANNRNCDPDSCDDKGTLVTVNFRPLLVSKSDTDSLITSTGNAVSASSFISLPDIVIPRWDVLNTNPVNAEDISTGYGNILSETFITNVQDLLSGAYDIFKPVIKDEYPSDPFAVYNLVNQFAFLYNGTINTTQSLHIQYYYDHFSDLIDAYHEFCIAGNKIISSCCPEKSLFPRHLLLGEAIPLLYDARSAYRHCFRYSPLFEQKDLLVTLKSLFCRMDLMLKNFLIPPVTSEVPFSNDPKIKITPGKLSDTSLSSKSIPYYYTPAIQPVPLYQQWNIEKTITNRAQQILSYNSNLYATDDFGINPLYYNLEPYNFFRIEGIIGKDISPVLQTIKTRISDYRLPFKIVALATGSPGKVTGNDDCCFLSDLELQFRLLRKELLSCLENNLFYWGSIEKKKDDKGKIEFGIFDIGLSYINNFISFSNTLTAATSGHQPAATETRKMIILEISMQEGEESKTAINKIKGEVIRKTFREIKNESMAGIYLEYQNLESINMASLPKPKPGAKEENIPYYILIIIDEMEQLENLLASENFMEFNAVSFNNHIAILYDACSKLGTLLSEYHKTEYFIEKIRINTAAHTENVNMVADAMSVVSENDAYSIILLLLNLVDTNPFVTAMKSKADNYAAQQATIKSFYDSLDKDGMYLPIIKDPDANFKSRYSDMLEHLKSCKCSDFIEKLKYLIERYNEQLAKLKDINNFSVYVKKHPGLQHKAGVATGGTFIIVYKGSNDPGKNIPDNKVMADFYLPYTCCNNCTPVEVTVQEASAPQNNPPKAVAEADKTNIYLPDDYVVKLSGQKSTDPDSGATLTYAWTLESGTSGAVITNPSAMNAEVSFSSTGLFVIKLTITDNNGATDTDKVFVMASEMPNKLPVAIASANPDTLVLRPGKKVISTLDGNTSYDPEGKDLIFGWSLSPGTVGARIISDNRPATKVEFTKPGIYLFTLTVTDAKEATATAYTLVNVIAAIPCASLDGIIAQFDNLINVDNENFKSFTNIYSDYNAILGFYNNMQEIKISSQSINKKIDFFGNELNKHPLEIWLDNLQKIILNKDNANIRLLGLMMLSIHAQLAYYIACIQNEDIDNQKVSVIKSLEMLIEILDTIKKFVSNYSQKEKDILKVLLNITIEEKDRVLNNGEESSKKVYLDTLLKIIDVLLSMNL